MISKLHKLSMAILVAVLVVACGGGGAGGVVAGIERLGISSGVVTGFGSIIVNEDHLGTGSAAFLIDDSPGMQSDLKVGDVVVVSFDPDSPTLEAMTVFANEIVEGPVDSIDSAMSQIVVAGQTVIVDADTSFDDSISPASVDGLMAGEFVEVSGLFNANGDIQATRIEPSPAGSIQVHGVITNHNPGNQTFMIRNLVVDYSTATIDNGFPGGQFDNGDLAEVKGATIVGGTLQATKVEPDGVGAAADDRIDPSNFDAVKLEIEGFITRFVSASDFDVAGVPVTTTGSTTFIFDDGTTATSADIGLNVKVEAEGNVNASGTLVATKVKVRRGKAVRIVALVDDANGTTNIVTLLGIDVRVDAATRIEDKSNAKLEPFGVGDMSAGDYVEVRGTEDVNGTGDVLAARLERDDVPGNLNGKTELQGFVEAGSVMQPDFSILGVTINASGAIFRDIGGNVISQNAFFSQLNAGDLVKVKGTETSMTVIVADEVEFETP